MSGSEANVVLTVLAPRTEIDHSLIQRGESEVGDRLRANVRNVRGHE